jgi:GxxExxY protein
MELNKITSEIINSAIEVHKELGPGLLESVYHSCMFVEIVNRELKIESEVPVSVVYKGVKVNEDGFRLDLLVEGLVVVELKSVEKVQPVHKKQLLSYLRLSNKPLGLLINFNETKLVNGITRIVNGRDLEL